MSVLQKEYVVIGKERVPSLVAWPVIMFLVGGVATVALLASRSGTLEGGYAAGVQTFQASTDFSGTQGYKNWYYLDGDLTTSLTYYASHAKCGSNPCWRGSETYQLVAKAFQHPGHTRNSVRAWKAPSGGSVTITGTVKDLHTTCGDGVAASIKKDATLLWSASIANGDTTGKSFSVNTSLASGQYLYFILNRGVSDNNCDSTVFDPKIEFTPDDGALPDLITNHQTIAINGTLSQGSSLTFTSKVKNIGTGTAAAGSIARWCIDNANCLNTTAGKINTHSFNAFGPGVVSASRTSSAWIATTGTHTIWWCADVSKVIAEANETNNCHSRTFTVSDIAGGTHVLYRQPSISNIDAFAFGQPPPPRDNQTTLILWQQGSDAVSKAISWDVGQYTGFRPSSPYSTYQRGKVNTANATAVQAQGRTVGIFNAPSARPTVGDLVPIVFQHFYPLGTGLRPWSQATSELQMSADVQVPHAFVSGGAVGYVQFSLAVRDTTALVVKYFWIQVQIFDTRGGSFNESLQGDDCAGCTFTPIIGSAIRSGTKYVHMLPGSAVSRGSMWSGFQTYAFGISRAELQKAIQDIKNRYPAYGGISTKPEDYEVNLLGVLDEIYYPQGSSARMGASFRDLQVSERY